MIARQHSVERRYREVSVFAKGFQWIVVAALIVAAGIFGLAAGPAATQTAGPFGGFKHDSTAPIEIVADALEVQQTNNLAIFTGDVVAAQATLRLTTDNLTVTYAAEKSDADTGAIQHMRADGNVFLSNGSETAQGAWAEYDVANGMMRMGGSVVLTQGENATAGDSLVINLNTGVGKIEGGRVKSVFTPAAKTPETEETTPETPPVEN
jgi:lipopolysaccharide export system protein LptA